jgi:branched-chain amino acid transport system permease protein
LAKKSPRKREDALMSRIGTGASLQRLSPSLLFVLAGAAASAIVLAVPLNSYVTGIIMQAATYTIAVVGLTVVLGYAGQITLAQAAFFGIGAYCLALGILDFGLNFWVALALAVVASGAFGAALGLTSVRLGGHYLAMITITFQQIFALVLTNWIDVTRGPDGVSGIPRPRLFGFTFSNNAHYLALCLVVLSLVMLFVWRLRTTRLGRQMAAVRDNELAASVNGINAYYVKVVAFTISSALAGLGGALFASGFSYISPDQFSLAESIVFLTMALLGGVQSAIGTALGASILILLPEALRFLKEIYLAIYGAAVVLIMIFMPDGIWGYLSLLTGKQTTTASRSGRVPGALHISPAERKGAVLEVTGLSKHFGGLKALDRVDLTVQSNTIHALIGPNGSGKTTCVNVLSGLYKPTSGKVVFEGRDVTALAPHALASRGIARTFQNIRLFSSMSCLENVMIGAQRPGADLNADNGGVESRAVAALDFVGLIDRVDDIITSLPYGHQRKVEIARALAANPQLILLDEPAAGLNSTEKQQLVELLHRMKRLGLTILIIEHDMSLIEQVADAITVLNFGERISGGVPAQVLRDPAVVSAYLGKPREYVAA